MTQLSKNFSLEEFTFSQTATRENIENTPTSEVLVNLKYTSSQLELIRWLLGNPILISSGYRSPALNKFVKGAKDSQHVLGQAVDFTCPKLGTPKQIVDKIKASSIVFDQLILEFDRWVHISFVTKDSRKQVLVIDNNGTRTYT